jgi:hypothetical protein
VSGAAAEEDGFRRRQDRERKPGDQRRSYRTMAGFGVHSDPRLQSAWRTAVEESVVGSRAGHREVAPILGQIPADSPIRPRSNTSPLAKLSQSTVMEAIVRSLPLLLNIAIAALVFALGLTLARRT